MCKSCYNRWYFAAGKSAIRDAGPTDYAARFWSNVDSSGECWIWTAGLSPSGYGRFHWPGAGTREAHRLAYLDRVGSIPAGLQLDHLCRVRRCVRPDHLEAVPQRVNLARGLGVSSTNAAKTHCIHGHEFTPENTRVTLDGKRECRTCKRSRDRRFRASRA